MKKNKLFMSERHARYFIEITDIRCKRVQDISDDDCFSEGIYKVDSLSTRKCYQFDDSNYAEFYTPKQAYAALFDKINGKGTWESNPYVWVYDYKLVK